VQLLLLQSWSLEDEEWSSYSPRVRGMRARGLRARRDVWTACHTAAPALKRRRRLPSESGDPLPAAGHNRKSPLPGSRDFLQPKRLTEASESSRTSAGIEGVPRILKLYVKHIEHTR